MLVLPCAPSLASSALMDRKGDFERGRAAGEGDRRRRWCRGWCRGSGAALTLTAGVTASGPTVRRNEGGLFVYGPRRDCIQRNASAKKIDAAPYRQSALQEGPQIHLIAEILSLALGTCVLRARNKKCAKRDPEKKSNWALAG